MIELFARKLLLPEPFECEQRHGYAVIIIKYSANGKNHLGVHLGVRGQNGQLPPQAQTWVLVALSSNLGISIFLTFSMGDLTGEFLL